MPTALPRPPRVERKRTIFDVLFNAVMLVSALALTFVVLVREERYALGRPDSPPDAIEQTERQVTQETSPSVTLLPRTN